MVLQVRRVPKHSKENPDLRRGLVGTLFERRIVGCMPKVPHQLEMKMVIS